MGHYFLDTQYDIYYSPKVRLPEDVVMLEPSEIRHGLYYFLFFIVLLYNISLRRLKLVPVLLSLFKKNKVDTFN